MLKERQLFSINNSIVWVILLFNLISTAFAQEETKKPRVVLTNDEFSTSLPKEQQKTTSETSKIDPSNNKSSVSDPKIEEIPDIDLQFKALDIQLALAQDPKNQTLRQQQIDINTQLRQSPLKKPSSSSLRDLAFKQRFIELKVSLINLERQKQQATSNIQKERRKVIRGSQGNSAFEGVRAAEDNLETLQNQVTKLQIELNALIEEGRRLGVSTYVFR